MPSRGTTRRAVRIEDGLWEESKAAASERGDNLSEVMRQALKQYINRGRPNEQEGDQHD